MGEIKRYDPFTKDELGYKMAAGMEEDDDGLYVLYTDHQAALAAAQELVKKLEAERDRDIAALITKAAEFIGTEDSLRSIACIDVALDHGITARKELYGALKLISALTAERNFERARADKGWKLHQKCHDVMEPEIKALTAERDQLRSLVDGMMEIAEIHRHWGWLDQARAALRKEATDGR